MTTPPDLTIIVPAHNEEGVIVTCLRALLASDGPNVAQIIVVANGCSDETSGQARDRIEAFAARGWQLQIIELESPSKPAALNAGDDAARAEARVYLDADVVVSPGLLPQLANRLSEEAPVFASGAMRISAAQSLATRAYGRLYAHVPFMTQGVPGAGLFALNASARQRWGQWPDIVSDDTFARLHFRPEERYRVPAAYDWPLPEGFAALIRVRRRQNRGVAEIAARYPELLANDDKRILSTGQLFGLVWRDPVGFLAYTGVAFATRFGRSRAWERGR